MKVSLEEYNQRVQSVNETLRGWCEGVPGITFRTHKREAKRLDDDGIHIREIRMKHYWRSVEQAIMANEVLESPEHHTCVLLAGLEMWHVNRLFKFSSLTFYTRLGTVYI